MNLICDLKLAVVGGDARELAAARTLAELGAEVAVFLPEDCEGRSDLGEATRSVTLDAALTGADAVLLPLPVSLDGVYLNMSCGREKFPLAALLDGIPKEALVLGGNFGSAAELVRARSLAYEDYGRWEEFAVAVATPTAEGALALAMHHLLITLHGAKCAVIGCGRIGFLLASKLRALGAEVTVAARKAGDLARIEAISCRPHHTAALARLPAVDVIFNTVPAPLFDRSLLASISAQCAPLYIELASLPGGIDREAAAEYGISVIDAQGLPGKVAPVTAGRATARCVMSILAERGVLA